MMNIGREIIPASDNFNRKIMWFPLHESATHNVKQWRMGSISTNKLMSNLKLNSVNIGQKERLIRLLDQGKDSEFVKWYTIDKVRSTHFVYDKFGRSVADMEPSNRSILGLTTWPRGAFEAYYHNVTKPILAGAYTNNRPMIYEGIKNLSGMAVGLAIAQEGMKRSFGTKGGVFGEEPYGVTGVISWNPMTPGTQWFIDTVALKPLKETVNLSSIEAT
jgi:hypothetical protein